MIQQFKGDKELMDLLLKNCIKMFGKNCIKDNFYEGLNTKKVNKMEKGRYFGMC